MTFAEHLKQRGSLLKARRSYMRERRWFHDEWYTAWPNGLADEVEAAARGYTR